MNARAQKGVALISIMLVVVLATMLAVQMTREQSLVIQRSAGRFDMAQARQYALGGEELARQMLAEDFEADPGIDHLGEAWALAGQEFQFENGAVVLSITDLQGQFNLNNLAATADRQGQARQEDAAAIQTLGRLLSLVGMDPMYAARIRDWVDADDARGELGAEDFDYLGLEQPYRAADRPLTDVSELRLILEMENDMFEALSPFVTALPAANTPINVNTASATLLASLVPDLTSESAEGLIAARENRGGYPTVEAFLQEPALAGTGLSPAGLGVQSVFFRVGVQARYLERYVYLTSLVQRNTVDGSMRVVYRDMSRIFIPETAQAESSGG